MWLCLSDSTVTLTTLVSSQSKRTLAHLWKVIWIRSGELGRPILTTHGTFSGSEVLAKIERRMRWAPAVSPLYLAAVWLASSIHVTIPSLPQGPHPASNCEPNILSVSHGFCQGISLQQHRRNQLIQSTEKFAQIITAGERCSFP